MPPKAGRLLACVLLVTVTLLCHAAGSKAVPAQRAAGASPSLILVSNSADNTVSLLDPETGETLRVIPVGPNPHEIAVSRDHARAFIATAGQGPGGSQPVNAISMIDIDGRTAAPLDLGQISRPHDVRVSRDGSIVWVACAPARSVLELDARTGASRRTWQTTADGGWFVAATPDDRKLYVPHLEGQRVTVIDRERGTTAVVYEGGAQSGIDIAPDGASAWVVDHGRKQISVIETAGDRVVATVPLPSADFGRVRFARDGRRALVVQERTVTVFDTARRQPVGTITLPNPGKVIDVAPAGSLAVISHPDHDRVSLVDLTSLTVVRSIATGKTPDGVAWVSVREGTTRSDARGPSSSQVPRLWGGFTPGSFAVGFRREPVEGRVLDVWYPAVRGPGATMTIGDYLRLSDDLRGSALTADASPAALQATLAAAVTGDPSGIPPARAQEIAASPMMARREAPPMPGPFPLVLWTPRYATTAAQALLSEFLATHGFVVGFARPAAGGALPFELKTVDAKLEELRARTDDMRLALRHLGRSRAVNAALVGVLAWSYTGEMATSLQLTEPRVRLVAGLSTTLVNDWVFQDRDGARTMDPRRFTAAYAVLTQPGEDGRPTTIDRIAHGYYVEFPRLAHGSFNFLEGYLPSLVGIERTQRWSRAGEEGRRGYEAAGQVVLRLLRHYLVPVQPARLAGSALLSGIPAAVAVVAGPGR